MAKGLYSGFCIGLVMKNPKNMTTKELIELADEIKRGMGNALLEDYKKLKESFKYVLVK